MQPFYDPPDLPLRDVKTPTAAPSRNRYISLMQVSGCLAVIAFHVGVRWGAWGWIAVELFFVLAGFNMARAVSSSQNTFAYGRSRFQRMAPAVAAVWCVVALMTLSGAGTPGARWFLISSPAFLQNLSLPLFAYQTPNDYVFAPLWFLGAMLQLQLLLFVFRRVMVTGRPSMVVAGVVVGGTAFRLLAAVALGEGGRELSDRTADALYSMPLTHVEAITLGLLVGRGSLVRLGRYLPILAPLAIGVSVLSARFSPRPMDLLSFGFEFPLRTNYMYVWGYTLLAFAAAALCSPENALAVRVRSMTMPSRFDASLSKMASLTFGVYVVHGMLIAFGSHLALRLGEVRGVGTLLFVVITAESFVLVWIAVAATRLVGLAPHRAQSHADDLRAGLGA